MPGRLRRPLQGHYKAFAAALIEAREHAKLTQRALAERIGVAKSAVDRAESGDRRIDAAEMFVWAEALGTTPEALLKAMRRHLTK